MAVLNGDDDPDVINFRPLGVSNDVGRGFGANDVLLGGAGNDRLFGGDDNDTLFGDGGNDVVFGEAGNDALKGGAGEDRLDGGSGDDDLRGAGGDDHLIGGIGKDLLLGAAGSDQLFGGTETDVLDGGAGQDLLRGGLENAVRDDFVFKLGQSNTTNAQVDTIVDWGSVDRIVSQVAGSAANYGEHAANAGGVIVTDIETAKADAELNHTNKTHFFFYDSATDTGYLVSDLNNDNIFESGVVLNGAGSNADFNFTNIIV